MLNKLAKNQYVKIIKSNLENSDIVLDLKIKMVNL